MESNRRVINHSVIRSDRWISQVCQAIGVDENRVGRIVIDAQADELAKIYITFYGGEELLTVDPPNVSFSVIRENAEDAARASALSEVAKHISNYQLRMLGEPGANALDELAQKIREMMKP